MMWIQRRLQLPSQAGSVRLITDEVLTVMPEIETISVGLLHLFLQHTSASLTINENVDPDVRRDLEMGFDRIVPETLPYRHTLEGRDDMPAHLKSSMLGVFLNIPVENGRLLLGTWQGIYLCEHRRARQQRTVILTLYGETVKSDA